MIETILTIMIAGITTVGVVCAAMIVFDIWRKEDRLTHK